MILTANMESGMRLMDFKYSTWFIIEWKEIEID